jgi:hypothetical protein
MCAGFMSYRVVDILAQQGQNKAKVINRLRNPLKGVDRDPTQSSNIPKAND